MFLPISGDGKDGDIFLKLKARDAPQIKYNPNSKYEITIFPNDGSQEIKTKISEGTRKLLFDIHPDVDDILIEDFNEYFKIYKAIGDRPGASNRIKNIINTNQNKDALNLILEDFNKKNKVINQPKAIVGTGLINSNEKLMKRLNVLSSAYKAGHTNVLQEMTTILDNLLERKIINKKQYQEFIN